GPVSPPPGSPFAALARLQVPVRAPKARRPRRKTPGAKP
ncbi:MAG: hypothetical protein JWR84_3622, partial [Caulobacter sp.]|nr:hypothetical protein [Caulobacter sp.]